MPVTIVSSVFNSKRAATELSTPPLIPQKNFLTHCLRVILCRRFPKISGLPCGHFPGLYGKPLGVCMYFRLIWRSSSAAAASCVIDKAARLNIVVRTVRMVCTVGQLWRWNGSSSS